MIPSRRSNGPVTREKLIEAAGEIFAQKGLHGASIRDITRRAGANIASVNYHFHDKAELYAQVLRQAHAGIAAAMSRPLSAPTPEGRLRELLLAILTAALDPVRPKWHRRLISRELIEPTPALELMHEFMQQPMQRLWDVVREMRPDLPRQQLMLAVSGIVAQCMFHVHHGHIAQHMFPNVPQPAFRTLVEHVVSFSRAALDGLPAGTARARPARRTRERVSTQPRPARTGKRAAARGGRAGPGV